MNKEKAAIYVRVSVLKEEAVSPEMQLDKARKYCELNDEKYEVFKDLDFSGKDTNRPAFQQMQDKINMGLISKVVVYRLDRVSRSVKDLALFMESLKENDVEFCSITENFDTTTPMGRAMINIMGVFAQMEREVISQRILDTKAKQMADGIKLGIPPYGYRLRVKCQSKWVIVPKEAELVKIVFQMYATGKWSSKTLATYLNDNFKRQRDKLPGQSTWRGGEHTRSRWQPGTVNCIIRNPSYAGMMSPDLDGKARNYEPIISYELYRQCQEIREKRSPNHMQYQHSTTSDYPLKGKIFCYCGWPMGIRRFKTPEIFFFCRNFHKGRHTHHARSSMIFKEILDYLKTCKIDRGTVQKAKRMLEGNNHGGESEKLKLTRNLRQSYQRLQEQYIDGEISKPFLKRKTSEIELRLQKLQPKPGKYTRDKLLESMPDVINNIRRDLPDNRKHRETIIDLFVEKVVWRKDHIYSLKIYDEFSPFFHESFQPKEDVSAKKLIRACEDPKPTIYQIRTWNFMGLLPDTGRCLSKARRYDLNPSVKRIRKIMHLRWLGYDLEEIGRLLKGKKVLVRKGIIARKLSTPRDATGYWLRKLVKPTDISPSGERLYHLDESMSILMNSKQFRYDERRQPKDGP